MSTTPILENLLFVCQQLSQRNTYNALPKHTWVVENDMLIYKIIPPDSEDFTTFSYGTKERDSYMPRRVLCTTALAMTSVCYLPLD